VHAAELNHQLGIRGCLGIELFEAREVSAQVLIAAVQLARALEAAGLALVLDFVSAVLDGSVFAPGKGRLGRQVLALLDRFLVARVGLKGALVEVEGALVFAQLIHHGTGALEAVGVLRRDLGDELEHGAGRLEVLPLGEHIAQHQVGVDIEGVFGQVLFDGLDTAVHAPGLA